MFNRLFVQSQKPEEKQLFNTLAHKILLNLFSHKPSAREIAAKVIERIAVETDNKVVELLNDITYTPLSPNPQNQHPIKWS
mmetsp:Transcript_39226/g.59846  ORF Transcript_39226/g.59846 Transcript_39226/m.59846 type:complete len:81 (+) Transcript_39226:2537-2779(+)